MSQQRQFHLVGGNNAAGLQLGDTTYTKIFVGGLAWATQRETMRRYFEQFGEIQEAVVITDKNTGRSKGYGFVTFKDPDAAIRACQDPSPVIDGRRANCNLASLGAHHRTRPPTPKHGAGRFRAGSSGSVVQQGIGSSSTTYFHQHRPPHQYAFPSSAYGYSGYSQESMYPVNYYSACGGGGGQQFSPYFTTAATSAPQGIYPSFYPFYAQYPQSSQTEGYGVQHPQMAVQYPYLPHHFRPTAITVASPRPSNSAGVGGGTGSVGSETAAASTTTEQSSS